MSTSPFAAGYSRLRIAVRLAIVAAFWLGGVGVARAQFDLDQPPLNYSAAPAHDRVARLQQQLAAGKAKLPWDKKQGYLPALLHAFGISDKSQTLVFSKTSFQRTKISPAAPRALYFDDDVYLGFVPTGDLMEIAAVDPEKGPVFYTIDQRQSQLPKIKRQVDNCLECHASAALNDGAPSFLVRSLFADSDGLPILTTDTYRTTFRSPLSQRWGGWYVTGEHGRQRHLGNMTVANPDEPTKFDMNKGANLHDLSKLVDTKPYPTPWSDIVALMVLEDQTAVHNQITVSRYQTLLALRDQKVLDELDGKPAMKFSDGVQHRIDSAASDLVDSMLFVGEAPLTDRVRGLSGFEEYFSALGPRDSKGRSLRDFDLEHRMFKYPCNYLIYSAAFDALPPPLKKSVVRKLADVLDDKVVDGKDTSDRFANLSPADRRAIREILDDTKPGWRKLAN